jgi:hypothetical protein
MFWADVRLSLDSLASPSAGRTAQQERRSLLLSASLAGGIPVDLRDAATGLDDRNIQRLVSRSGMHPGNGPSPGDIYDRF